MRKILCVLAVGCGSSDGIVVMDHGVCDAYLACSADVGAASPGSQYQASGSCWKSEAAAADCRTDCGNGLTALRFANPTVASCLPDGYLQDPKRPPYGSVGASCAGDADCGEYGHCLLEADHFAG